MSLIDFILAVLTPQDLFLLVLCVLAVGTLYVKRKNREVGIDPSMLEDKEGALEFSQQIIHGPIAMGNFFLLGFVGVCFVIALLTLKLPPLLWALPSALLLVVFGAFLQRYFPSMNAPFKKRPLFPKIVTVILLVLIGISVFFLYVLIISSYLGKK